MGLFTVFRLCIAFLSLASVSLSFAALPVAVDPVPSSKVYRVTPNTLNIPSNVSLFSANDPNPFVTKSPTGGLTQNIGGRLTVSIPDLPASNSPSVNSPVSVGVNVSKDGLKTAAKSFSKSLPYLSTALTAVEGIDYIITNNNFSFDERGILVKPVGDSWSPSSITIKTGYPQSVPPISTYPPPFYSGPFDVRHSLFTHRQGQALPAVFTYPVGRVFACNEFGHNIINELSCIVVGAYSRELSSTMTNYAVAVTPSHFKLSNGKEYSPLDVYLYDDWYRAVGAKAGDFFAQLTEGSGLSYVEVPLEELEALIDSQYDPFISDWDELFPFFPQTEPYSIFANQPDPVALQPMIRTITNTDTGAVETTETSTSLDYSLNNNPSPKPDLSVDVNLNSKEYVNGNLKTNNNVSYQYRPNVLPPNVTVTPPNSNNSSGGSMGSFPDFCTWASPVCSFYDWMMQPFDNEEPDLSAIISDDDYSQSYDFRSYSKTCPEPLDVHISFLNKDIQLSYSFACDVAEMAYFFIMLSAYVSAIFITLGVVRNA